MSNTVDATFPNFVGADGQPLDNGFVYVGTAGLDPVNNAIATFWDSSLSTSAAQPIRTSGGYLQNSASPGKLFVSGTSYSITVKDKNGVTVYSELTVTSPTVAVAGNIDSESATDGYVLTADGAGGSAWEVIPSVSGTTNLTTSQTVTTVDVESDTGTNATLPQAIAGGNAGVMSGADKTKLDGVESGATADQSDAEIETAYNTQVGVVSQVDAEAGTSTTAERWTPERVEQAITALAPAASADGTKGAATISALSGTPTQVAKIANKVLLFSFASSSAGVASTLHLDTSDDTWVACGTVTSDSGTLTGSYQEGCGFSDGHIQIRLVGSNYEFYEDSSTTGNFTYIYI